MKIIHRYILRELYYYFAMLLLIVGVIALVYTIFETREEIFEHHPPIMDVIEYLALSLPKSILESISLVALFAVLFAMGLIAKSRELIAMVAAGVSFTTLAVPVAIFGLTVAAGSFALGEWVVPAAEYRAKYLYEVEIKGKTDQQAYMRNDEIFRKGAGGRFYIMQSFTPVGGVMSYPSILDKSESGQGLSQRIEARSARLVPGANKGEQFWEFDGAQRWTFNPDGSLAKVENFTEPLRIAMEEKLDSFLSREKPPDQMRFQELREFIDILQRQGGTNPQLPRYQTWVQAKIAVPLSCLLLALMGFSLASELKSQKFVADVSRGLVFALAFYMFREMMMNMGRGGALRDVFGGLAPYVAAWTPLALFSAITAVIMRRLSTVH